MSNSRNRCIRTPVSHQDGSSATPFSDDSDVATKGLFSFMVYGDDRSSRLGSQKRRRFVGSMVPIPEVCVRKDWRGFATGKRFPVQRNGRGRFRKEESGKVTTLG